MSDSYWLRHSSLQDVIGPSDEATTIEWLRTSVVPADVEVLPYRGDSKQEARESDGWRPATEVFGSRLEPEAECPEDEDTPESEWQRQLRLRGVLRAASAYRRLRILLDVFVGATVLTLVVGFVAALVTARPVEPALTALTALVWVVLTIAGLLLAHGLLHAFLDLGDCALLRERRVLRSRPR